MIAPQAASTLSFPLPEVFGSGVTTVTPDPIRFGQSRMPLGLVLRTTKTIVDE